MPTPEARARELLYAVSHDLQAPLRHLTGYLGLLRQAGLEGDDLRHLEGAVANAQRMQRMMDAVLALSRLETTDFDAADVDLGALVREVVAGDAAWSVGDLPVLRGDAGRLRRLVEELVDNARTHGAPPFEVHGERTDDGVRLEVRDGGPGFPERFAERATVLFKILHDDREHLGAGLAIARRVAEQHGGELHLETDEGEGCVAVATLRDAEA